MPIQALDFHLSPKDLTVVPPPDCVTGLVEALLDGNKEAEKKFYELFQPLVKGWIVKWNAVYFRSLGLTGCDVEDDCQSVLIRLIYGDRHSGDFTTHESPLRQWLDYAGPTRKSLYRFVQWNANFYLRDLRRRSGFHGKTEALSHSEGNPGGVSEVAVGQEGGLTEEERLQLRRCSRKCWRMMNPSHREVLESVGIMGLSQSETARRLGVSEATISRWLREATKKFRECLEENCPEELLPF
jgi:RNA polymerase sigma factor (sigma-70 family)